MGDLDAAANASERATKLTSRNHPNRTPRWNRFRSALQIRFERQGSNNDLNAEAGASTEVTSYNHSDQAKYVKNLSNALRFEQMGSIDDFGAAAKAGAEAVSFSFPRQSESSYVFERPLKWTTSNSVSERLKCGSAS